MSAGTGHRPTDSSQLTHHVSLLAQSDQRSPVVTSAQLDAIAALLGLGPVEVEA